jgi:hypothetical protein
LYLENIKVINKIMQIEFCKDCENNNKFIKISSLVDKKTSLKLEFDSYSITNEREFNFISIRYPQNKIKVIFSYYDEISCFYDFHHYLLLFFVFLFPS